MCAVPLSTAFRYDDHGRSFHSRVSQLLEQKHFNSISEPVFKIYMYTTGQTYLFENDPQKFLRVKICIKLKVYTMS